MFEYYILVILLNLLLKKGSQAKEDIIELKEQFERGTSFDDEETAQVGQSLNPKYYP
jgi:hypothetical protein